MNWCGMERAKRSGRIRQSLAGRPGMADLEWIGSSHYLYSVSRSASRSLFMLLERETAGRHVCRISGRWSSVLATHGTHASTYTRGVCACTHSVLGTQTSAPPHVHVRAHTHTQPHPRARRQVRCAPPPAATVKRRAAAEKNPDIPKCAYLASATPSRWPAIVPNTVTTPR